MAEKVTALEAELEKMKEEVKALALSDKSKSQRTVYINRDRKVTKFSGRPSNENEPTVEEWIDDVQQHIKCMTSTEEKLQFINDHLQGKAKDEIRVRADSEKTSVEQIFEILKSVFQDADTVAHIQQLFYQRDQKKDESLQDYSLQLLKLVDRLIKKGSGVIGDKNLMLKERFIDGVSDFQLRREMRRFSRDHPDCSFHAFRQEILRWTEDGTTRKASVVTSSGIETAEVNAGKTEVKSNSEQPSQELLKLIQGQQELITKQQQQLELLASLMKENSSLEKRQQPYTNRTRGFPRSRGYNRGMRGRGRGQGQGPRSVKCFNCNEEGHYARQCPKESAEVTVQSAANQNQANF